MPFWSRKKQQKKHQNEIVSMMQSESLGMTIIEDDDSLQMMQQLTQEEWIDLIEAKQLSGFPFKKIYFSFLKGVPDFLRMKIWLLLCTENNSKQFKFSCKKNFEQKADQIITIKELTLQIFKQISEAEPQEKESEQIQKDIKRSFSEEKQDYKYTAPLLRKLLYALSNSGVEYSQGMNYILLNIIIYCFESLGISEQSFHLLQPTYERDIFIIMRETVIRMDEVFGKNNIFKVMAQLQNIIAESVPEVLFVIYKLGMDCFSAFSQNYYSVMSYNDPPKQLCKLMLDLFFLVGEKAIHATILRMLEMTKDQILKINDLEQLQKLLKKDIYFRYYENFEKERESAKKLSDFGLCFFQSVQEFKL